MTDILTIAALVISIMSIVLIIIEKVPDLLLGYREKESTVEKKKVIDAKLKTEVKDELSKFLLLLSEEERNEEKELEALDELGLSAYFARHISSNVLDGMTNYAKSGIKYLALSIPVFLMAFIALGSGLTDSSQTVFIIFFFGFALFIFYMAARQFIGYYRMRERFLGLSESPTLEFCEELHEQLRSEGLD